MTEADERRRSAQVEDLLPLDPDVDELEPTSHEPTTVSAPAVTSPHRLRISAIAFVALGGSAGTLLRVAMARSIQGPKDAFPYATFVANLIGAFLVGAVIAILREKARPPRRLQLFLATGFCGGLTTFSTLMVETDLLVRDGHSATGLLYLALSVVCGLGAVTGGIIVAGIAGARR